MFGIGPTEFILIFLILIILFGAKRLPELARALGHSIKEFKRATEDIKDELDISHLDEKPLRKPRPQAESQVETKTAAEPKESESPKE